MLKRTIVVSAFPACGKSYTYNHFNGKPFKILDSDSTLFHYIWKDGKKTDKLNPNFISDYIAHIKENIGKVDVIFVSSHKEVRKALRDNNISCFYVYPKLSMKQEFLRRMKERGNDAKFINTLDEHFEEWVTDMSEDAKKYKDSHLCLANELSEKYPYIDNKMLYSMLDDSMGNLSCYWWNYGSPD